MTIDYDVLQQFKPFLLGYCNCECGKEVVGCHGNRQNKFIHGHSRKFRRFNRFIPCACGCERLLLDLDDKGRRHKYIHGHQNRVRHYVGDKNPMWKGGIAFNHGYVLIYKPLHPFCTKRGYISLHRLIMEKHLGRYLEPYEDVHHINGIKTENLFSNLILLSHGDHSRLHRLKK